MDKIKLAKKNIFSFKVGQKSYEPSGLLLNYGGAYGGFHIIISHMYSFLSNQRAEMKYTSIFIFLESD